MLESAAVAAARRNNASLWYVLPSLGNVYQDSLGSSAASFLSPFGLLLDRQYGPSNLGPELVSDPDINNPSLWVGSSVGAGTYSVGGGEITVFASDGSYTECGWAASFTETGKTYLIEYDVTSTTGAGIRVDIGGVPGVSRTAPGNYRQIITAISNAKVSAARGGGVSGGTVSRISVREMYGRQASQATTANKPTVVRVPRRLGPDLLTNKSNISALGTRTVLSAPNALNKSYYIAGTVSADLRYHDNAAVYPIPSNRVITPNPVGGGLLNLYNAGGTAAISIADVSICEVLEWSYALQLDGSGDALTAAVSSSLPSAETLIVASQFAVGSSGVTRAVMGRRNGSFGLMIRREGGSGTLSFYAMTGSSVATPATNVAITEGVSDVLSIVAASGNSRAYRNGALLGAITSAYTPAATSVTVGIGSEGGSTGGMSGSMCLECYSPNDMPDADRINIERFGAYLAGVSYAG